jgi:NADH-quinone oxidoreductase subunit A
MLRDYLPVLLQIVVAMGFAASALFVSVIVGKSGKRTRAKDMVAMLFILFDLEIVFMYPWAVVYREMIAKNSTVFWSMLSFISILMVGYVYAIKKGALDWKK